MANKLRFLNQKIRFLKQKMKEWRHNHLQNIEACETELMAKILQFCATEAESSLSNVDWESRINLQEEFRKISTQE